MGYAGRSKYDEPGRAARYRDRDPRRDAEEWALLARLLDGLEPAPRTALDVPCGTGRIAERLLGRGLEVVCADLSPAMRAQTGERLAGRPGYGGVVPLDLEAPGDGAPAPADLVVCLRFLHHLPDAAHRRRVWASLRGLARGWVVVSFHHPLSGHQVARVARRLLTGRRGDRHVLSPRVLAAEARAAGLGRHVLRFLPLARWRREFWLALLDAPGPAPADGPGKAREAAPRGGSDGVRA
jgi:SAM-dependent methyltransferase